ncbi:nucleoside phosphorylase [Parabacteroides pacaensis]|uniref:nucleoside phosphorylase n=1 Tax=Parabacteroides pacaensis TaxID=2086575 RepID=UPI000D1103FC|nr:nucleoside phosphorylase [Parabacteroides pacaensis]
MRTIPSSELIINEDGSIFHLHLKPEQLADKIILVGDPGRVTSIATLLDSKECEVQNREFHSVTGIYKGKRLTIVSHGIGCDNIDIVLNELDALANIDFTTRTVRPEFRQLTLVRIGTSGGLQPFVPVGTFVAAEKSIGFDGVIFFYQDNSKVRDNEMEVELIRQLEWKLAGLWPYVVSSDKTLLEQIAHTDMVWGMTIAANGFYGPQGRFLRLPLTDPELNKKIESFQYKDKRITNFEMESSALAGLSSLLGHKALTVCCIIAGRLDLSVDVEYKDRVMELVELVLNRV